MNRIAKEKYSSAVTLSDMEIFIFPELLYSLVLANIMSPEIWKWREDPWFIKMKKMSPYRRILRLKQYIVDHFEFNLDLDTWGLTEQEEELARFDGIMDRETISQSNALFGYHGDQYYFDIDIRRHFGLDQYTSSIIPYWKTETLEAMQAFRHKEGYETGAGECVSLSALYAAALFVVCGIPLEEIFLMATPLHSQNYVAIKDGIVTNNRRVVTKNMWFNGTELTAKAQRALRNERVTIIAHNTGYTHIVYPEQTIDPAALAHFENHLSAFLSTGVDLNVLLSFLRFNSEIQGCFQIQQMHHGKPRYVPAEKVFAYEHTSKYTMNEQTWAQLVDDVDEYEFFSEPIEDRILLNMFVDFFRQHPVDFSEPDSVSRLVATMNCKNRNAEDVLNKLREFCCLKPNLPDGNKQQIPMEPIRLEPGMSREEVIAYLESKRADIPVTDLAFYAYRDLARIDHEPFLKAALERNPVSAAGANEMSLDETVHYLEQLPNESIYDGTRAAQPDEVWNFGRGDGLEKAICLANILNHRGIHFEMASNGTSASLRADGLSIDWKTEKGIILNCTGRPGK